MMRANRYRLLCEAAVLACVGLMPVAPAHAQADHDAIGADDIVVTARRREELLQDVPISVAAFTGDQLEDLGVQSIVDLQRTVPSLNMGTSTTTGGRKSISPAIRGVRSSAVTTYFADVVQSAVGMSDLIYDLQSVQVLKGPQGTLFGSNSTAGAILFQPARATEDFAAKAEVRAGNYDEWGLTGMVNFGGEGFALRIAGDREKRGGFLKGAVRDYDADDHWSLRGGATIDVGPFKNWLMISHYQYHAQGSANVPIAATPCPTTTPSPAQLALPACFFQPPRNTALGFPTGAEVYAAEIANGVRRTNLTGDYPRRLRNSLVSNVTQLDLGRPLGDTVGNVQIKSILGYSVNRSAEFADTDGTILPIVDRDLTSWGNTKTTEFQLLGDGERFNWVLGFYSLWSTTNTLDRTAALAYLLGPSGRTASIGRGRQTAFFGQATIKPIDGLSLTAGYRTTKTTQTNNSQTLGAACTLPAGAPGVDLTTCTLTSRIVERQPSYTFSVDYKFNPDGLIYATTRRGFNQGGLNVQAPTADQLRYRPEKLTDYEIGIKQDFHFGDVFARANLAVFRSKYTDIQRRNTPINPATGRPLTIIINAAKATIDGVEGEFLLKPVRDLTLNLGVAYVDARYDEFKYVSSTGTFDLSNNTLAQAPKWTIVAGLDYRFPEIQGLGQLGINVSYSYQSFIVTSDFNDANPLALNTADPNNVEPGYSLVNARASIDNLVGSGVKLSVWARNLFDKQYFNARTNAAALGFASGLPGEPRTFGVTLSREFD